MVNLMNTCVLVKTRREYEYILNEAEKQGFHWYKKDDCKPFEQYTLPDILKFSSDNIVDRRSRISLGYTFYEASELLGTKEMTAREFAERIADVSNCCERECIGCVLNKRNNKCNNYLCDTRNWGNNIDKLLEIVKTGIQSRSKAIDIFEKFIENPDRAALNDEFVESLKLAVEKLKEEK